MPISLNAPNLLVSDKELFFNSLLEHNLSVHVFDYLKFRFFKLLRFWGYTTSNEEKSLMLLQLKSFDWILPLTPPLYRHHTPT